MKKTKFFAMAGLTTLAIVSIFGTKPERKFNAVSQGYCFGEVLFTGASSLILTTHAAGTGYFTAQFSTVGSTSSPITLRTASGGAIVRFHS